MSNQIECQHAVRELASAGSYTQEQIVGALKDRKGYPEADIRSAISELLYGQKNRGKFKANPDGTIEPEI